MCLGGENGFDLPVTKGQGRPLSHRSATADRVQGLGPAAPLQGWKGAWERPDARNGSCTPGPCFQPPPTHSAVSAGTIRAVRRPVAGGSGCEEAAQRAAKPGAERSV